MRKVLFLMFLLLLMGLGAAGVRAQVRIGGNAAPDASAVLDLNADGTNNGTKGLALPRVNLTSNTMQLTSGVANLTGMMVYNTTATLGGAGIYFWNSATWVKASLPATSAADSGKFLMSDGSTWTTPGFLPGSAHGYIDTVALKTTIVNNITFSRIVDTTLTMPINMVLGTAAFVRIPGINPHDFCYGGSWGSYFETIYDGITVFSTYDMRVGATIPIICYRPSA